MGVFFSALCIVPLFFGAAPALPAQESPPDIQSVESGAPPETPAEIPPVDESSLILEDAPAAPAIGGGSSVLVMLRMVLVLAVAALAIYGVVFFIKRLARPQESRDPHLKVLARVPLSGDSFAAVISLGPKAWLVGGGSGGVNLISEVDDVEILETMLLDDARRSAAPRSRFIDLLRRLGKIPEERGTGGNPGGAHAENLRRQRERLKGL